MVPIFDYTYPTTNKVFHYSINSILTIPSTIQYKINSSIKFPIQTPFGYCSSNPNKISSHFKLHPNTSKSSHSQDPLQIKKIQVFTFKLARNRIQANNNPNLTWTFLSLLCFHQLAKNQEPNKLKISFSPSFFFFPSTDFLPPLTLLSLSFFNNARMAISCHFFDFYIFPKWIQWPRFIWMDG